MSATSQRTPRTPRPGPGVVARLSVAAALALTLATVGCAASDDGATVDTSGASASTAGTTAPAWRHLDVAVDGGTVGVDCIGEGSPTVWFVSDLAMTGAEGWGGTTLPEQIGTRTTACTSDRPGLGASTSVASPATVEEQATQLAAVIEASGVPTPVVLVGQGTGTFITRLVGRQDLPLVAGMVLVDPTLWESAATAPTDATPGQAAEYQALAAVDADLGGYGGAALPPPPVPTVILGADHTRPYRPTGDAGTGTSVLVAPTTGELPSTDEIEARQHGLANKSPFGRYEVVADAGASVQHWDPAAVVDAITWVLDNPDLKS